MKLTVNFKYLLLQGLALIGALVGVSLGVSNAALPKKATPAIAEIKADKANLPDFEKDYVKLNSLEGRYAETWDQQQKLKSATGRVASAGKKQAVVPLKKKSQ